MHRISHQVLIAGALILLSGCATPFHDGGDLPPLTQPGQQLPMKMNAVLAGPEPEIIRDNGRVEMNDNSIWSQREAIYFRDTRAFMVGDILTVRIAMNDSAKLDNSSSRDSNYKGGAGLNGSGTILDRGLPVTGLTGDYDADSSTKRAGSVNRAERIQLQVAATVIQAAPNGNLFIQGSQEVRVNHEMRILTVTGVVRSKDILPDNSIAYEKIAEARISYGGKNNQPGYKSPTTKSLNWTTDKFKWLKSGIGKVLLRGKNSIKTMAKKVGGGGVK